MHTKKELISLAKKIATVQGLDPALVCAVCEQESAWRPWVTRYEPAFLSRYVKPENPDYPTQDETAKAYSWGLMQVMGLTAREHGYRDELEDLLMPELAIGIGCRVLKGKLAGKGGDVARGLLAYNGGGNMLYPKEVMARMAKYEEKSDV